jgi:hypothetical protein
MASIELKYLSKHQKQLLTGYLPGGASGLLVRGYKGKEADRLATRIAPGWYRWLPISSIASARPPRNWARGRRAWSGWGGVIALTSQPFSRNRHLYRSRSFNSGIKGLTRIYPWRRPASVIPEEY